MNLVLFRFSLICGQVLYYTVSERFTLLNNPSVHQLCNDMVVYQYQEAKQYNVDQELTSIRCLEMFY